MAGYYLSRNFGVSGSDLSASPTTDALKKQGAIIYIGKHKAENVKKGVDLIVHTAAATKNNSELKQAKKLKIKTQLYAEALGYLTKKMFTIAVSGMHGKSTTTAMLALVLEKAGLDPTVIVGTKLREWNNMNYRVGKSKYLVIEADEYNASFLNYWPKIIVLTNIEEEHLDFYKDLRHIMKTFKEYVGHLGKDGILVVNGQDANVVRIARSAKDKVVYYRSHYGSSTPLKGVELLNLRVLGKHNISNAMAVLEVAKILKIPRRKAIKTLNNFQGTWRRMEYRGEINGARIYDDYGHHPTEIKATLEGAKELLNFPLLQRGIKGDLADDKIHPNPSSIKHGIGSLQKEGGRVHCIFQPHQYQRTYKLFEQFINAFDLADKTIILPIYSVAGREKESIKKKVSSEKLVKEIKRSYKSRIMNQEIEYINSFARAKNYLEKNLRKGDVCVIMGAGDVYKLTEMLLKY